MPELDHLGKFAASMEITLAPRRVAGFFAVIGACLSLVNLGMQVAASAGHDYVMGLAPLFDVTAKRNLLDLYLAACLFVCAALAGLVTYAADKQAKPSGHWAGLLILLLFLAIDQGVGLHDRLTVPMRAIFHASDLLYSAWIIPYGVALAAFILVYLPFLRTLPSATRLPFGLAALGYLIALIGCEALAGRELMRHGDRWSLLYGMFESLGAFLKMSFVSMLILALLKYMETAFRNPRLRIATEHRAAATHSARTFE